MLDIALQTSQALRYGPGGGQYRIVTTSGATGSRHFAFEATEPPGGGPPLHIHLKEDELFTVTEGEISFYIDGEVTTAWAGQSAFVPRGVPHCFKNRSNRTARVLVLFTPGEIEGFFDYGLPVNGGPPSDEYLLQRILDLAPQFGLQVLGPSPL